MRVCFVDAGNIPDVLLLQLKVGINAYFHRLYAMYPCSMLRILRRQYCHPKDKKMNSDLKQQFEAFIAVSFATWSFVDQYESEV